MTILSGSPANVRAAARILLEGGMVVIPTETVYGLACRALDPVAVGKVFAAKGRPPENPLIVHVASPEDAEQVAEVSGRSRLLMTELWPGPLTLVLPKKACVPEIVTAGLSTVAIRMPAHPVALAILTMAGPLAAPSANRFSGLSPTEAEDVDTDLGDLIVIDGGPCEVGIESTVLDLTGEARILRLGQISRADVEGILGEPVSIGAAAGPKRSPGLYSKHYAPRKPVRLVDHLGPEDAGLGFDSPLNPWQEQMPRDPDAYAAELYHALSVLDRGPVSSIAIERPPEGEAWAAIWDRLRRATGSD